MKIVPSFVKFTKKMDFCPLCSKKRRNQYSKIYYNRYSDEISKLLNVTPKFLMETSINLKCKNCGLIYKKKWFKRKILDKIYTKNVPSHPSGWDKISNKFSKNYLTIVIKKLKTYIRNANSKKNEKIDILLRRIKSVIFSIKINNKNEKKLIGKFLVALKNKNLNTINKYQRKIISIVNEPRTYSRFKGFEDENLFNFIENKIGKIYNYAEIGCPLWGMINIARRRGCKTFFIKPDYSFFWGKKCEKNGIKCINKISNFSRVTQLNNTKYKFDFVGAYALLDHYDNFIGILKKIFSISKSVGIISEYNDKNNRGIPIQHCFGLNEKSAKYIAKRFNKRLSLNFQDVKVAQYKFYLFY